VDDRWDSCLFLPEEHVWKFNGCLHLSYDSEYGVWPMHHLQGLTKENSDKPLRHCDSSTYSETRSNFASLWDKVIDEREPLTIHRRGAEDVSLLPTAELRSLQETAYLMRSPKNARRLLEALMSSIEQQGETVSLETLRKDL
jgi:antitoxin YefM